MRVFIVYSLLLMVGSAYASPYIEMKSSGWTANEGIDNFYVSHSGFEGELDPDYAFGEYYQGCDTGTYTHNGLEVNLSCQGTHFSMTIQKCDWTSGCSSVNLNNAPVGTMFEVYLKRRSVSNSQSLRSTPTCPDGQVYASYGDEPMHCQKPHVSTPHQPRDP